MKYALNLSEDNRILSACIVLPRGTYVGQPIVDTLPEGNLPDYLYENGEFIYSPLPKEEPCEPTTPSLEDRVSILETKVNITISEYEESLLELGVEL